MVVTAVMCAASKCPGQEGGSGRLENQVVCWSFWVSFSALVFQSYIYTFS